LILSGKFSVSGIKEAGSLISNVGRMKKIIIFTSIVIISLEVIFIVSVIDPFSIPFQDWDQIPEEQKQTNGSTADHTQSAWF
jgi:hypothetical protein